MGKRVRSIAWDYFRKRTVEPGLVTVQCILCEPPTVKKFKGNTTNLLRHIENHHGEIFARDVKNNIQAKGTANLPTGQPGLLDDENSSDSVDSNLG